MKNIYLYGASDDCCEIETDFDKGFEAYSSIKINGVVAEYKYHSDWGIKLIGDIPSDWVVKYIEANAPRGYFQFIHIQVPDNTKITYEALGEE